jgi:lysine 2,3-aminomutase
VENKITPKRILKILDTVPELKAILITDEAVDEKRRLIRYFLSDTLNAVFEDNPTIPPLEWIQTRNAVNVLRSIVSKRNERLAGFSLLTYINDLIHGKDLGDRPQPGAGFYAEFEHLLRAVVGKTAVYSEKVPPFLKHSGRRAARLRSKDLGRMAANAEKYMARYPFGLDRETIAKRKANKQRILKYFGAADADWEKWKWHTSHIIRDAETLSELVTLTPEEFQAVEMARQHRIPFGITPYYLALMDPNPDRKTDYAVRAQVIPPLHYVERMKENKANKGCSMDFMLEQDTSPIDGITRRYPHIVILKPVMTCPQICVYCQRNWEIEDVYSRSAMLGQKRLDAALEWIEGTPGVKEVLVTGGDPLLLANDRIEKLLGRLSRISHVERIRIGTRMLVTLPQRITDSLVDAVRRFHVPGKREVVIMTHFEHQYEITPQSMAAVQKFRRAGMGVYNQMVFTFHNSRRFEAAAIRHRLRLIGVTPYYTFNAKGKEETDDYRVPIARLLQEQHEEARLMPGTVRTDEIVFNVPKLGKNYLRAGQHHDIISILPDGRRVYEFHPWEKKLSLVDTYVYTDVSIYDYLERLKKAGEDARLYSTIWYYY